MAEQAWKELERRYTEPHRAYHNLLHISECLTLLDETDIPPSWREALELALWYHDAVYDTRRHDNEEASAALARQHLEPAGCPQERIARVEALILATKHHVAYGDPEAQLMVDIDLAIIGSNSVRFEEYEAQIRQEYAWVPDEDFRKGRAAVLEKFLGREQIYHTLTFHGIREEMARHNLKRSLDALVKE